MKQKDIVNSFNTIFQQYYEQAFMFVKSYVDDNFAAEDIVAESLLKIWNVLKYEQINNVSSLLFTILKNNAFILCYIFFGYVPEQSVLRDEDRKISGGSLSADSW